MILKGHCSVAVTTPPHLRHDSLAEGNRARPGARGGGANVYRGGGGGVVGPTNTRSTTPSLPRPTCTGPVHWGRRAHSELGRVCVTRGRRHPVSLSSVLLLPPFRAPRGKNRGTRNRTKTEENREDSVVPSFVGLFFVPEGFV